MSKTKTARKVSTTSRANEQQKGSPMLTSNNTTIIHDDGTYVAFCDETNDYGCYVAGEYIGSTSTLQQGIDKVLGELDKRARHPLLPASEPRTIADLPLIEQIHYNLCDIRGTLERITTQINRTDNDQPCELIAALCNAQVWIDQAIVEAEKCNQARKPIPLILPTTLAA